MTSEQEVREIADVLGTYATHFSPRDWDYTRDLGSLREIRYDDRHDSLRSRLASAWCVLLAREKNLPDGVLDNGNVIVHWEETGEYMQLVQPSVGAIIAEWLAAEPDNPHAQRVASEMRRIQDAYAARLQPGKDEG